MLWSWSWSWSVLLVDWLISTLVKITVLSRNNLVWISGLRLLKHHLHAVKSNPSIQYLSSIRSLIINPYTSKNIISSVFETLTLSTNHRDFTRIVFDTVRSFAFISSVNSQFKVESLSVLPTIAEHDGNLVSATIDYDENVIIELCFDSSVSVRYWILKNVLRFGIRDEILVGVLLGFINDPYPYVRRIALNGLVRLRKSVMEFKNGGLTAEGYNRAVDLFVDRSDCVRAAAIRVVCEWWQMLLDSSIEDGEHDWFDSVFVQLCSMVRDMSVEVRNEAFVSLGEIKMLSEDILLQTLTKKVRRSACNSLGMLISFSVRFANDALNLLMDMLNDHSMVVRLQTLEIMYHMATCGRLKVQEAHMHMDEADIFSILFYLGSNHGSFAVSFVTEVSQESSCNIVIVISSPLTHEHLTCSIPAKIFSYVCLNCMKCWEDMKGSSIHSGEVETAEIHVCRFAVLVSLTSKRIADKRWALLVYRCLGSLGKYLSTIVVSIGKII
ncbi:hypothetical protein MKX01_013760 [Papaver californicum]|nr:hypothetical protein MKX01_013760 [Papaver californicum]